MPYTDRAITAEVTPGIVAPVYPPRAEYPPESSANPEYPPEVYAPPEAYEQTQVALIVRFHIILTVKYSEGAILLLVYMFNGLGYAIRNQCNRSKL